MIVVGLTGSIGMGKSAVGAMFRDLGVPVFDSDAAVHQLYAAGGAAVPLIAAAFPNAVVDGAVDRTRLAAAVLHDTAELRRLEGIVHPLVRQAQQDFRTAAAARGEPLVVYDIPLLFEGGGAAQMDRIVVVSAPAEVQRARVLARPGMTAEKFAAILAKQMPDSDKRRRAHHVIDTGVPLAETRAAVAALVAQLRQEAGHA